MNKIQNQIRRARKAGMSNLDLLRIQESAKKAANKLESEAVEKAFLYMLAIPLNVLVHNDDLVLAGHSHQDLALYALVLTGQDDNGIIFLNVHTLVLH